MGDKKLKLSSFPQKILFAKNHKNNVIVINYFTKY